MNYSTLQEAYNIDSFEKKKKSKKIIEESPKDEKSESLTRQDRNIQPEDTKDTLNIFKQKPELQPYYDEELDQYLNYREFNEGPLNEKPKYETSREDIIRVSTVAKTAPLANTQNNVQTQPIDTRVPQIETHVPYTPIYQANNIMEKKDLFYKNLVNIGLFIFIGVLIIFLCDQITEIAISIGMKRTVILLEPYLQNRI